MDKISYIYNTEIGKFQIIEESGVIIGVNFNTDTNIREQESKLIRTTYLQIKEYLQEKRKEFDIPIKMYGTEFQKKVWKELQKIPYGETRSYKQIAENIGNSKACRAVGMANHNNPIAIIIPCHRVIGTNDKLVGYAGGIDIKQKLLNLEKN
jgi:methylated-DNA-[protein]-cysteine S-methyltransferase